MSTIFERDKPSRSQQFLDFVRRVGDAKSKLEEEKIVRAELIYLKNTFKTIDPCSLEMHECLIRAFYCELLGYSAAFAHIHAIKHIPSVYSEEKKIGYMSSIRFLAPGDEFLYLMISNLQRDLKSSNFLDLGTALDTVANITESEIASVFIDDVKRLCQHENGFVRKKAFIAALAFTQKKNIQFQNDDLYRVGLSDSDPQVMNVALCLMEETVRDDPNSHHNTIPSLITILSQIIEHRLPRAYDFHRIPAPWTQIHILKILRVLLQSCPSKISICIDPLLETIKRSDVSLNIGNAIIYEAICVICSIESPTMLLDVASKYTSKFISSNDCNQVFVGINALSLLVTVDMKYAIPHQYTLIDLLEDEDQSIRIKSIKLLSAMTSFDNVEIIANKLLEFLKDCIEEDLRGILVSHLFGIISDFYPDEYWFIDNMCEVITRGSKHVSQEMIEKVMNLIAHSALKEDGDIDNSVRQYAVQLLYDLIENSDLGDPITKISVWIIGEFSFLDESKASADVLERLCDIVRRPHLNTQTKCWVVTACTKVVSRNSSLADVLIEFLREIMSLYGEDLLAECFDLLVLLENPEKLVDLLPQNGSCTHADLDLNLEFLDPYIKEAIENGSPPFDEDKILEDEGNSSLRFDSYGHECDVAEESVSSLADRITNEVTLTTRVNKWSQEAVDQRQKKNDTATAILTEDIQQEDGLGINIESATIENSSSTSPTTRLKQSDEALELTEKEKFARDIFLSTKTRSRKVNNRRSVSQLMNQLSQMEKKCSQQIDKTDSGNILSEFPPNMQLNPDPQLLFRAE